MRDEASGTPDDAPSSRRPSTAVIGELAGLRHSATELAASPATMSPAHAVQVASVLSALGVEAPSDPAGPASCATGRRGHQPRCRAAEGRADGSEPASVKACSALIRSCR